MVPCLMLHPSKPPDISYKRFRCLSYRFLQQPLQFFYRYRIVLIAEMAVHLDGLTLIDHLLQFLLSDADQSLLDALSGAVAGELSLDLIKNLQTEITQNVL